MANTLRFKRGLVATIPTALAGEPLFTTDTFDLYIGNGTTNTRFQKYIASGATTQILRGDGSLYTFPLAISSPTTGQVLKYNGTSWVNDSDAGITGSLTANYLPKATGATTLANSILQEGIFSIGVGVTPNTWRSSFIGIEINSNNNGAIAAAYLQLMSNAYYNASAQYIYTNTGAATRFDTRPGGNAGFAWNIAASGTAGNVITWTEAARIHSTGNFGINTGATDSGEKLQVTGDAIIKSSTNTILKINSNGGNAILDFITNAGTQRIIGGLGGSNNIDFYTNSVQRMKLDASGNLGLGVTPSAWESVTRAFQIGNSGSLSSNTSDFRTTVGSNFFINTSGTTTYLNTGFASQYLQVSGTHRWLYAASGTAGNAITFTEGMRLDASGNLLVATTTASNSASGRGNITIGGSSTSILNFQIGGTLTGYFYHDNNNLNLLNSKTGGSLLFSTESAERARVTQLGNLHIGTFSSDSGEKLQVNGTAKITGNVVMDSRLSINTTNTNGRLTIQGVNDSGIYLFNGSSSSRFMMHPYFGAGIDGIIIAEYNSSNVFQRNTMTISAGGNVGIGIVTPSAPLHVSGNAIVTGNLTVDTNTLFVDATNNRVAVGSTTPQAAFVVSNGGAQGIEMGYSATYTANFIESYNRSTNTPTDLVYFLSGTATHRTYTNGIERVRVKSGGQVRFVPLSSAPSGAEAGDVYYDSTTNKLTCYNGTTWNDLF